MELILVSLAVFAVLCIAELGKKSGLLKNEYGRKFVHVIVGSFVAFWPLFLTWNEIVLLSCAFIVVVLISRYAKIFQSIHAVKRSTWGEVFFALVVGVLALLVQDGWIYMAALLHLSLADGLAAVVGQQLGKSNRYSIFGPVKSIAGTATFAVLSIGILITLSLWSGLNLTLFNILGIAAVATLLENASFKGLDNLSVPLWVAFALVVIT